MSTYTKNDNTFKYFIIGILVIAALLIVGIIALSGNDEPLRIDNVSPVATESYGNNLSEDEYFVYFYYPECGACKNLMESSDYLNFIENPKIRMYKININEAKASNLFHELNLSSTPTAIHVKIDSEGKYNKNTMVGSTDIQNIFKQFTK